MTKGSSFTESSFPDFNHCEWGNVPSQSSVTSLPFMSSGLVLPQPLLHGQRYHVAGIRYLSEGQRQLYHFYKLWAISPICLRHWWMGGGNSCNGYNFPMLTTLEVAHHTSANGVGSIVLPKACSPKCYSCCVCMCVWERVYMCYCMCYFYDSCYFWRFCIFWMVIFYWVNDKDFFFLIL